MKAVILAGGKGTRSKPFTDFFPKAMIPIQGKPLIDYVVGYLSSFSFIEQIIIVSDFEGYGSQIKHYLKDRKKLKFVQDSEKGTAGDLLHLSNSLKNNSEFVLWFVDNLCAIDIKAMHKHFTAKNSLVCIATRRYRKEETGFASVKDGIIVEFIEKPQVTLPNNECLGIYMVSTKIFKNIRKKFKSEKNLNLSFHILEDLAKKKLVSAFDIGKKPWIDAESPVIIQRNEKIVSAIVKQMKS